MNRQGHRQDVRRRSDGYQWKQHGGAPLRRVSPCTQEQRTASRFSGLVLTDKAEHGSANAADVVAEVQETGGERGKGDCEVEP